MKSSSAHKTNEQQQQKAENKLKTQKFQKEVDAKSLTVMKSVVFV